ncbi:fructose-bisphosphate aldolase class I [Mycobacterium frederiksbergense]|uniref:class I fructose-bisphosphate aldolase n=1 Tax=Mycolicibacterium frederiksbergense TaxID=117567 RepID=UPI0021F32CF8|nr:class I fructose-bisphosphate aldolase [Mycolicibacterium frederiksbergense]MCV7043440.1 fructose-bisphosphate aldolase class I [Mycolicibacterium frederiksbergense]
MTNCRQIAAAMMAPGKGILAADESIATMSKRLKDNRVEPTAENRRYYREMLASAPGLSDDISGIIFCDETLKQSFSDGKPFPQAVGELGILAGIKVDTGAKACPGLDGETITEGLDDLPARLAEYAKLGAAFAKWRAVFTIGSETPTQGAIRSNANALARYAAACQQAGLVPIVEPEVLMDGSHNLAVCRDVTEEVHTAVRAELGLLNVDLAGIILKPNMVIEGDGHGRVSSPEEVAEATVTVLRSWPGALAGVAFLSGGQDPERATDNLTAMQRHSTPWPLTFSFGRALVSPALSAWQGDPDRRSDGQATLLNRVKANGAAAGLRAALR